MKLKNTLFLLLVRLTSSLLPSFLGLFLNYLILSKYGSEINGLISTIAQLTNYFHLLEGGITLTSTIALYKPIQNSNFDEANKIVYTISYLYRRISFIIIILSTLMSIILPLLVNTTIDMTTVSYLTFIMSISIFLNYSLFAKYEVIFSAAHKEYRSELITLVFNIISQFVSILLVYFGVGILFVKLVGIFILVLRFPILKKVFKRCFPNLNFSNGRFDKSLVNKSKDVFMQKASSLVFGSTDMIILAFSTGMGITSIYAVYNYIFSFIKSILSSVILAPFNGFGQLFSENNLDTLRDTYILFQFISIVLITIFLSSALIVTLPFITLYTINNTEINYIDIRIAILFSINMYFELLIDTLGLLGNSSGHFKNMKIIALIGAMINLLISILLVENFSIIGVLFGTLISYIVMFSLQFNLVHNKILNMKFIITAKYIIPNFAIFIIAILVSILNNILINNYFEFLLVGMCIFALVVIFTLIVNILFNRTLSIKTFKLLTSLKRSTNG